MKNKTALANFYFNDFECFKTVGADTYWKKKELEKTIENVNATQQLSYAQNLQSVSTALSKRKAETSTAAPIIKRT
ncbi:hypothetical protein MBANPS3_011086 [Mucor bainieri]